MEVITISSTASVYIRLHDLICPTVCPCQENVRFQRGKCAPTKEIKVHAAPLVLGPVPPELSSTLLRTSLAQRSPQALHNVLGP